MPPFPKPRFPYEYDLRDEVRAIRAHSRERGLPRKSDEHFLLATWNVANLGVQHRSDDDYALIAETCSWFDLVALQEVNDDLTGLYAIKRHLPKRFKLLFSDASGNRERQAFIVDSHKVRMLEEVGRLSIPPSQLGAIRLPGSDEPFRGFDRGPYLAAFEAGEFRFVLVNVHLFFGDDRNPRDLHRRCLEAYAVAAWADKRRRSPYAYTRDIIPLGDFNLPMLDPEDPVFKALTAKGLQLPAHGTAVGGSTLSGKRHYDQIAFFQGETNEYAEKLGVLDLDTVLFRDLWETRPPRDFFSYMRYHVSDHRPMWAQFNLTRAAAPGAEAPAELAGGVHA